VTRKEVFLTIERQVVAELADDDLSNEPWPRDAASNWPQRRWWAHHAIFAVPAGVLGPNVDVYFELRRNVLQDLAFILADAVLVPTTAGTLLVRLAQVMLVPKVRQLIEVEFPATATTCGYWARQLWLWLKQRSRCVGGFEIEQMTLPLSLDDLLSSPAVDPALQGAQFLERGLVRGLQRFVRRSRLIQHALQLRRFSESRQQELVALDKIIGKCMSVIHNAHCFSDSDTE